MTENRFTMFGSTIQDNGTDLTIYDCCDILNELNNENQHIKNTIQDMLTNERTQIGKNTLKQLWEAIQ